MIVLELEGVEIDRCLECHGTWLDAGEIETLTELAGVSAPDLSEAIRRAEPVEKGTRRCPRCRRRLEVVEVGGESPVQLDRCPRGEGLWLDRGELEAVVARFHGGVGGAVAEFLSEVYRNDLGVEAEGD